MKQKDIAVIIVVAFFSAIASFLISSKLFVTPENRQQKAEVVDKISANFNSLDPKYFNENSINPTQSAGLDTANQTPFKTTSQ
jgi:hypothetical protein